LYFAFYTVKTQLQLILVDHT